MKAELLGLLGFSGRSLKNMRSFYEAWNILEPNSAIRIAELSKDGETAGLVSQTSEMGDPAIQVAEFRQLKLTNLPNLIYGFTDEQLALAVSSVPPVAPPVAPPVMTPVVTPVMTPVGKPSETLIDAVQMRRLDRVRERMLAKVSSMLPARHFMTGHRYKGRPFSYFAFLEKAVRPTNMARQTQTYILPYSEL